MKIAYLVSVYPARSHTFIRREIAELEKNGFTVCRYSQRKYAESEILNDAEATEYKRTWSIFPLPLLTVLMAHINAVLIQPWRYFSVLMWAMARRPPGGSGVFYALIYFIQAIYLARHMRADGVRALHMHFVNSGGYVGAVAAEFLQIPWGASVHGRSDFDFPGVHALRWVLKDANFLRCVSRFGASQAMRQCKPTHWHKIVVSYCGLPDILIGEPTAKHRVERATLLSVGRLSAEKGQFLLLKAAAYLKANALNFRLVIAGDGPDRQQLERAARHLDVADVCEFIGAIDEARVMREMTAADVFICPSLMEGLPQVLMEAMAVNLPMVVPYLAGIPEVVTHRETGLLYPAGDWQKMAGAIESLLNDTALAKRCAQAGYELLTNEFVLSTTIQPLVATLRGCIHNASDGSERDNNSAGSNGDWSAQGR